MSFPLSSPTLGRLITKVRRVLRQPNAANSTWSDEELASYINDIIKLVCSEVTSNNEGNFSKFVDLDIVSDQEFVDLPSDFFEVRALYKKVNNYYEILNYKNDITSSYALNGGTSSTAYLPYYYFRDNDLILRPVPNFSETASLRLEYIYLPEQLLDAKDRMNVSISPLFEELIEMGAVAKAKMSESLVSGVDTSALAQNRFNALYTKFIETVKQRSKYPTFTVPYNPEGGY